MEIKNEYCERYKKNAKKVLKNYSPYAVIYDRDNPYFTGDKNKDLIFLRCINRYMNDKLRVGKYGLINHVYLNEVYQELGLPEVSYGWRVGWIYSETNPIGDNFIDFEIKHYPQCSKIIIDFNVDGDITPYVWGD